MNGSLNKTNCNFETPIPKNVGGLGIECVLVLGFFAVRLRSRIACILTQLAADIFAVMASNRKQLTDKRVYVHYVIWRYLVIYKTVTVGTVRWHQTVNVKGTTILHPNIS